MPKHFTYFLFLNLVSYTASSQLFIKDYSCAPVETEAKLRDGIVTWDKYLEQNIDTNIPIVNCAPPGIYKVEIRFLIERDGTLKTVTPLTKHGYGMETEVTRVIELSPKWKPATRNGRVVRYYKKESFTFIIPEFTTLLYAVDSHTREPVVK